jgi:hypothetical protein
MRFIAGSGRSGTTWVQDALAEANNLRPVFEPLHPAVSEIGARYAYRALAADDEHPELKAFLRLAAAGRQHKWWTQYRLPGDRLVPRLRNLTTVKGAKVQYRQRLKFWRERQALAEASRRSVPLVKCIRTNLMLGWLTRQCGARVMLIVRHPGAVVESQFRLGSDQTWDPGPVLERYRQDARLDELTRGRYQRLLAQNLSRIEALTACWVIENQWPIAQAPADGVEVVFYERLRSQPEIEWRRACEALDLATIPPTSVLARPSQQSSTGAEAITSDAKWLRTLTREQIDLMQGVLDEVGFDAYDMRGGEPRVAQAPAPIVQPARELR